MKPKLSLVDLTGQSLSEQVPCTSMLSTRNEGGKESGLLRTQFYAVEMVQAFHQQQFTTPTTARRPSSPKPEHSTWDHVLRKKIILPLLPSWLKR
jgi:hypothetical protein